MSEKQQKRIHAKELVAKYGNQLKMAKKHNMTRGDFRDYTDLSYAQLYRLEHAMGIQLRSPKKTKQQKQSALRRNSKPLDKCPRLIAYMMTTKFSEFSQSALNCFDMGIEGQRREV